MANNAIDQSGIQAARQHWLEDPALLRAWQARNRLQGKPVALYVSRLVYAHDLTILLEAWRTVLAEMPDATLMVVGDGPARDELERYTLQLGIDAAVRYLGAIYAEEQLAPLFLTAGVFAFPRRLCLSLQHAFGYGLSVVGFDNPAHHGPEFTILRHGVNGVLVREDDCGGLTQAVVDMLRDREGARKMGEAGRQLVLGEYSLDAMVDGFVCAIDRARQLASAA